jgi:F0F1-type ATP synthase assembly protein I
MNTIVRNFIIRIVLVTGIAFAIHLLVLNMLQLDLFANMIVEAYAINLVIAIVVYLVLFLLREKFKNQIGFLFILGSFFKFGLFFVIFHPAYKADDLISKPEFFAFFVPYILTLVVEVFSLSKWLNKIDELTS